MILEGFPTDRERIDLAEAFEFAAKIAKYHSDFPLSRQLYNFAMKQYEQVAGGKIKVARCKANLLGSGLLREKDYALIS